MKIVTAVQELTAIAPLLADADHIDVKTIESDLSLSAFIAGLLSYQPAWMTFLYRLRWAFVRLLGMKQQGVPRPTRMNPADVPWQPGEAAYFFKVVATALEQYWFAEAAEAHLTAKLGVVAELLTAERKRFNVVTVVHYNKWIGVVYFNAIRPFHHLVVNSMMKAAVTPNTF
jgi:hypothetical protein